MMSSYVLGFSAISRMISLNPCTKGFTQRILKGSMPQEVEKIHHKHVQKRNMPETEN